jgi:four helix bundle protein
MNGKGKSPRKGVIRSFKDLIVYQDSYKNCITEHNKILPKLPQSEKYDLKDQLSRSTKAIPRLIAEGYAKRHQARGFQKYLDDAMGECNESIVGLEQVYDLYNIEKILCKDLVVKYDKTARQLYKLAESWTNFKSKKKS